FGAFSAFTAFLAIFVIPTMTDDLRACPNTDRSRRARTSTLRVIFAAAVSSQEACLESGCAIGSNLRPAPALSVLASERNGRAPRFRLPDRLRRPARRRHPAQRPPLHRGPTSQIRKSLSLSSRHRSERVAGRGYFVPERSRTSPPCIPPSYSFPGPVRLRPPPPRWYRQRQRRSAFPHLNTRREPGRQPD